MMSKTFIVALFGLVGLLAVSSEAARTVRPPQMHTTVGTPNQIAAAAKVVSTARVQYTAAKVKADALALKAQMKGAKGIVKYQARNAQRAAQRKANTLANREKRLAHLQSEKPLATLLRKKVRVAGQRLPLTCYCKKVPAGESKCYFFTAGSYCSVRYCAPKYQCTAGEPRGRTTCLLRIVHERIMPRDKNSCRREKVNSFMYIPYAAYNVGR